MSTTAALPELSPTRRNLAVIALVMTTLISTLDASIVNVAIPVISRSLNADPSDTVWVTTACLLATACAVPATSALGDQIGRKRLFVIGVPWFTLASLGAALSTTLPMLVTFRALQGVGAATIFAVVIPMFRTLYPPARLGSILGINAMTVAVGVSVGPTLGGLVLSVASWQWLFCVSIPFGIISTALGAYAIPKEESKPGHYDWKGSLYIGAAAVAFMLGMRYIADTATLWLSGALFLACALLVGLFLHSERRVTRPVIPLLIWNRLFTLSVSTAFCGFVSQGAAFVALPFLFQSAYGATPLESALLYAPWPAVIIFVSPIAGRLADKVRPSWLALIGLVIFLSGLIVLGSLGENPATAMILFAAGLAGLGFGIYQSPNNREMQLAVPIQHSASAAAVLNLTRSIAQSTGAGVVSVALVLNGATTGSHAEEAQAAMHVLWVAAIAAGCAVVTSLVRLRMVVGNDNTTDH
ncbi:MAG: MFS transporter [Propionibacteriaceae bacterium]|nr:MFS transporter [Propionibacteriaceae bacterium]